MIRGGLTKAFLLDTLNQLGKDEVYIALVGPDAEYNPESQAFQGDKEISGPGYTAGGRKLVGFSCGYDKGIAWAAWNDPEWANATLKANGAVIYNRSKNKRIVVVLDFGKEHSSSFGMFKVVMPAPGPNGAVIWLS